MLHLAGILSIEYIYAQWYYNYSKARVMHTRVLTKKYVKDEVEWKR